MPTAGLHPAVVPELLLDVLLLEELVLTLLEEPELVLALLEVLVLLVEPALPVELLLVVEPPPVVLPPLPLEEELGGAPALPAAPVA